MNQDKQLILSEPIPIFSFLIPTRKRPEKLQQLFSSICETTSDLSTLEIILAIDEDDDESKQVSDARLNIKQIIVPLGKTMGFLNRACYAASSGRYVMLMNDDVVLTTPQWDLIVKQCFETYQQDDIVLVHVNDLIQQENFCVFPFVSRTYCELIGNICPEEYIRYWIDNHIFNIFSMLVYLGYKRIVYLPNVVFEHHNYLETSDGKRVGISNPKLIDIDRKRFEELLFQRKEDAVKLIHHIELQRLKIEVNLGSSLLSEVNDSYSIYRPEFLRVYHSSDQLSKEDIQRYTPEPLKEIKQLQQEIQQLQEVIKQLRDRIQAMESSKFWQLRKAWFRLKRAIGLTTEEA